jgi:multidrug efflux system outer membrane protein
VPRANLVIIALLVLGCALSGCMVGPNYRRPHLEQPARFKSEPTSQPSSQPTTGPAVTSIPNDWWKLYDDAELDRLIDTASIANQDLRQAIARVDQARALARVAGSFLAPTVTANPTYTREHTSANRPSLLTGQPTPSATFNDWTIPFDLTYEVDVWGRVRRSFESANAQARATKFDEAVIRLAVQSNVAQFYYALRSLDAQSQILNQTVGVYEEQVRVVNVQLKNGLVGPIDLYQAQALLAATQAQARDVERARADQEHALAILCGEPAAVFMVAPNPLTQASAPVVPAGLPAQLLSRRPDVAEAEQNMVAINAQVGVATAELYPTFSLTGTAGFESFDAQHLLDWKSRMATFAPSVSIPIFNAGRLKANLQATKAQYRQVVAAYVSQVLTAYGDVEDALTDLHAQTDEAARLQQAVNASQDYVRVANVQYKRGLVNYLVVIDAERTLLSNQLSRSQTLNQQTAASIHLIKALGGGWESKPVRSGDTIDH